MGACAANGFVRRRSTCTAVFLPGLGDWGGVPDIHHPSRSSRARTMRASRMESPIVPVLLVSC